MRKRAQPASPIPGGRDPKIQLQTDPIAGVGAGPYGWIENGGDDDELLGTSMTNASGGGGGDPQDH